MARGSPAAPLVKPERAEGLVGMVDQGLSCPEPGGRLSSVVSCYLEPQVAPEHCQASFAERRASSGARVSGADERGEASDGRGWALARGARRPAWRGCLLLSSPVGTGQRHLSQFPAILPQWRSISLVQGQTVSPESKARLVLRPSLVPSLVLCEVAHFTDGATEAPRGRDMPEVTICR